MLLVAMTDASSFRSTTRSESTKLPSGGHGGYINMPIGLPPRRRRGPEDAPAGGRHVHDREAALPVDPDHQWVGGPKGIGVDTPRLRATRGNDDLNAHEPVSR